MNVIGTAGRGKRLKGIFSQNLVRAPVKAAAISDRLDAEDAKVLDKINVNCIACLSERGVVAERAVEVTLKIEACTRFELALPFEIDIAAGGFIVDG